MAPLHSFGALIISSLLLLVGARRLPAYKHQAFEVHQKRQYGPPVVAASTTQTGVLTVITPSPGASPVQVTRQSQIVTSYIPQYTLCELPPLAFYPITPQPMATPTTAPYSNYSISTPPGNGTCTTIYKTTETMVCATVLSDLTTTYTVSQCPQEITFSTRLGYVLATPTPVATGTSNATTASNGNHSMILGTAPITAKPSIETLTTYYLARWQELTSAGPPADVDLEVCRTFANETQECIREYEVWHTSIVTSVTTHVSSINSTMTLSGPSQLYIMETIMANITDVATTVSLLTTVDTTYSTEWETTSSTPRVMSSGPTVTSTATVEEASTEPHITSTITRHITSTINTITVTLSASSSDTVDVPSPTSAAEPNYASMLSIGR